MVDQTALEMARSPVVLLLLPLGLLVLAVVSDSLCRALFISLTWSTPPRDVVPAIPSVGLAAVIPVHNEESIISATVRRLQAQASAGRLFVIADDCTDDTATAARQAGALVWERRDSGARGKGAALRWFLAAAARELQAFDAIAIFDADAVVQEGFLDRAGAALAHGADVVQGFVHPVSGGGGAADLAAYSEILSQCIDDAGRARLGWPVPLRGTGMVFRREILQELVPRLRTKVEDVEMSLLLAAQGAVVRSAPTAIVGDPKPATTRDVAAQRGRWLQGQAQVWRYYWCDILKLAVTGGPGAWALLYALLVKPKALVFALKTLLLGLLLVVPLAPTRLNPALVVLLGSAIFVDIAYYLVGLAFVDDAWLYARALLRAPLYLLMWLRGVVMAVTSREPWLRARD